MVFGKLSGRSGSPVFLQGDAVVQSTACARVVVVADIFCDLSLPSVRLKSEPTGNRKSAINNIH